MSHSLNSLQGAIKGIVQTIAHMSVWGLVGSPDEGIRVYLEGQGDL